MMYSNQSPCTVAGIYYLVDLREWREHFHVIDFFSRITACAAECNQFDLVLPGFLETPGDATEISLANINVIDIPVHARKGARRQTGECYRHIAAYRSALQRFEIDFGFTVNRDTVIMCHAGTPIGCCIK